MSHDSLLCSLRCASAALNSSVSEGQASALLEAMQLRVPIIARRNEGNESLVEHGRTGLLFDTPEVSLDSAAVRARFTETHRHNESSLTSVRFLVRAAGVVHRCV
jgi:glycosyltransferase involved in cell wall biosynthesis